MASLGWIVQCASVSATLSRGAYSSGSSRETHVVTRQGMSTEASPADASPSAVGVESRAKVSPRVLDQTAEIRTNNQCRDRGETNADPRLILESRGDTPARGTSKPALLVPAGPDEELDEDEQLDS